MWTRLTPHVGPTRHMFLEVDRVEGSTQNRNLESVVAKNV
jgi:hypothetical protein